MTSTRTDLLLTALAPAIWGSTYIVTTQMLPAGYPMTVAMLRALPADCCFCCLSANCRRVSGGCGCLFSVR